MNEMNEIKRFDFDKLEIGDIERALLKAVFDSIIDCAYCGYTPLEADYDLCPECHKSNPLKQLGLI